MSDPSQFASDWLRLREPIDHRSRAAGLDRRLFDFLSALPTTEAGIEIMDLGSGTGSNLRYLAPRLPRTQHWSLIDHDHELLERAEGTRIEAVGLRLTTRCMDLARFADIERSRPDLVTASAWLDLVSAEWIEQFAARLEAWRAPVLIALSVDGRRGFLAGSSAAVENEDDARLRDAFNQHQRQPKGLGDHPALGPDAVQALADRLRNSFDVELASSDWLLSAGSQEVDSLGAEVLRGWADAAQEMDIAPTRSCIEAWYDERCQSIKRGELGIYVGHQDLLALPK